MNRRIFKKQCKHAMGRLIAHGACRPDDFTLVDRYDVSIEVSASGWDVRQIEVLHGTGKDRGGWVTLLKGTPVFYQRDYYGEWDWKDAAEVWRDHRFWTPGMGFDKERETMIADMEACYA